MWKLAMNIVAVPVRVRQTMIERAINHALFRFTAKGRFVRRWRIPYGDGWALARLTPELALEVVDEDSGNVIARALPKWEVDHEL